MCSVSNCAPSLASDSISAEPVTFEWAPSLPIFAKKEFLQAVSDDYGWLGGVDTDGTLRCVLPYTIVRRAGFRMVRFRSQTIPRTATFDVRAEQSFLNSVVQHFRRAGADVIIPASSNSIFRIYPDGAEAIPYGTYMIDLREAEDVLWKNVERKTRESITKARRDGVLIREGGMECIDPAYDLIRETFRRSRIPFMTRRAFERLVTTLGENCKLMVAEFQGAAQSYSLYAFSTPCAYAIYAGNRNEHKGANKLLQWEAIRLFRSLGVERFDFYGARINPQPGSKQEAINLYKQRFGAMLSEGYMWKYALRPWRASMYSIGVRLLRGGDIVDQEAQRFRYSGVSRTTHG